ncbi:hypothetical protein L1987_03137 [Smallanthus sonchifolius]|uniref:Uncharacterized protein n=1 Tax=Smallanthus sonchifolius TaxID=185202 RepID=A0ACB9K9V5_9ASTR|nr:hypothetical protein L1987_03137 [Smallanthus sonchifolius]
MAEQTEKAFLKQPKVFLCSKKSGKERGLEKVETDSGRVLDSDLRHLEKLLKELTLTRNALSPVMFPLEVVF